MAGGELRPVAGGKVAAVRITGCGGLAMTAAGAIFSQLETPLRRQLSSNWIAAHRNSSAEPSDMIVLH